METRGVISPGVAAFSLTGVLAVGAVGAIVATVVVENTAVLVIGLIVAAILLALSAAAAAAYCTMRDQGSLNDYIEKFKELAPKFTIGAVQFVAWTLVSALSERVADRISGRRRHA